MATAADAVGWNYQWETRLLAGGPIVDGTLRGDLVVVGSGDPSIGGRAGSDLSAWIDALRMAGIRRIDGRVVGDDNAVEEPRPQLAWAWDDLGYTSGAIFGALNLNENRSIVTIAPGIVGGPATLTVPALFDYRQIVNRAVTGARGSTQLIWPEQRPGETALTIAGSIPVGASPAVVGVAIGNPTLHFAQLLRSLLVASGIEVTGGGVDIDDVAPVAEWTSATEIYRHRSPPLSEIVHPMLKSSVNVYAEAVLRLNVAPGVFPTNDAALEGMSKRLAAWGIGADDQQIVDGSGLSRRNTISAEALVLILRRMHAGTNGSPLLAGLPIAGVDGSLATRMRRTKTERNVRAKTGTMSNIRTLAGYVKTADGERLAFVVIVNNFEGSGGAAVQAIDDIALRLALFSRDK